MKNLVKLLTFTLFCQFFSLKLMAYEFKNFKVLKKLEYKQISSDSLLRRSTKSFSNKSLPTAVNSSLISELEGILTGEYENIGKDQTDRLLKNYNLGGGVLNFSGFTWHKPMANYDIYVNRELAPDLMSEKWIVQDTFTIFIEAATLLTNLKEQKQIEISQMQIGAFAGLSFKRTYRYNHFANNYIEGLTSDFSKLFLGFKKFNLDDSLNLKEYNVLIKEDEFSFHAGGLVKGPLSQNLSLSAASLIKKTYTNKVSIQSLGAKDNDPETKLRLSLEKEYSHSTQTELDLQADFFNLIKISLLEYELKYDFGHSQKSYLSLKEKDIKEISNSPEIKKELDGFIKGHADINHLGVYETTSEQRKFENLTSRFGFFLYGEMKDRATEQVHIVKDGVQKTFFKNFSSRSTYVEGLLSKFFQGFVFKIFNFKTSTTKRMATSKDFKIEYEKVDDLQTSSVKNEEQFSFQYSSSLSVKNTQKWYQKNFRAAASSFVSKMTTLPRQITRSIDKKDLKGPLEVRTTVEVQKNALLNFHTKSTDKLINVLSKVCEIPFKDWKNYKTRRSRKRYLRGKLTHEQKCLRKLVTRLESYSESKEKYGRIDLFKFKKFMGLFLSKSNDLEDILYMFGEENVFIYGQISALTKDGKNFQNFFKSGQFKGLGVIDNFKRNDALLPNLKNDEHNYRSITAIKEQ